MIMNMRDVMSNKRLCECQKCGYEWMARVEIPKECPDCKCRKWNKGVKSDSRQSSYE